MHLLVGQDQGNLAGEGTEHVRRRLGVQAVEAALERLAVERLLQATEAVCAEAASSSTAVRTPSRATKRQEARLKWAKIARQNEKAAD